MNEEKSKAFLVFSEFGPDRAIPRHKRLADTFPRLTPDVIDQWIIDFQNAEKIAFDVVIEHRRNESKPEYTSQLLKAKIPGFSDEALKKLFNQACYFAMHDGY
jgi:hypothetical protein